MGAVMIRKLDFVVFGMPRGGTTAVASYISAVDALFCSNEVFPTFMDHSGLDIPAAFLEQQANLQNPRSVDDIRTRGDEILRFGNKTPTYFYRLNPLLEELDNCPAIACVRDPRAVANSYSMRASAPKDLWQEGRVGLFAIGDALLLLHALHQVPADANVLIMPQNALLDDWSGAMQQAIAHIAPDIPAVFSPARLKRIDRRKKKFGSREKPGLEAVEERALKRMERDGVTAFFDRRDVVPLDAVRGEIGEILARTPANPVNFIHRLVADHPNPEALAYFDRWSRHSRKMVIGASPEQGQD